VRTVSASDLKATCLALLDDVSRTGEPVLITKRGRPIARLVAVAPPDGASNLAVEIIGDIVAPALPADAWEAEAGDR
jgi:prevent-host-death family protein